MANTIDLIGGVVGTDAGVKDKAQAVLPGEVVSNDGAPKAATAAVAVAGAEILTPAVQTTATDKTAVVDKTAKVKGKSTDPKKAEEFKEALAKQAKAQDQKEALDAGKFQKVNLAQTKEGQPVQSGQLSSTDSKAKSVGQKKWGGESVKAQNAQDVLNTTLSQSIAQDAQAQLQLQQQVQQLQQQVQAMQVSQAAQSQPQQQLQQPQQQQQQGPVDPRKPQLTPVSAQVMKTQALREQQAAQTIASANVNGALGPQQQMAAPMVLQPIVMQMPVPVMIQEKLGPMDMPYEVLESSEMNMSPRMRPMFEAPIMTSQDYLAQLDRQPMRRDHLTMSDKIATPAGLFAMKGLPGTEHSIESQLIKNQKRSNANDDLSSRLDMMIPQAAIYDRAMAADDAKAAHAMPASGAIDLSRPSALATPVMGLVNRGGGAVKLRITPEHLGEVTISVQNKNGKLDVKMETSSSQAREVLQATVSDLRDSLTNSKHIGSNIEVKHVGRDPVQMAAQSDAGSNSGNSWGQQSQSGREQGSGGNSTWDWYMNHNDEVLNQYGQGRQQQQRGGYRRQYDEYMMGA